MERLFLPNLEEKRGLPWVIGVRIDTAQFLSPFHHLKTFYIEIGEIGINRQEIAMTDNNRTIAARNGEYLRDLTLEHRDGIRTDRRSYIDALVVGGDVLEIRMRLQAKMARDGTLTYWPMQRSSLFGKVVAIGGILGLFPIKF